MRRIDGTDYKLSVPNLNHLECVIARLVQEKYFGENQIIRDPLKNIIFRFWQAITLLNMELRHNIHYLYSIPKEKYESEPEKDFWKATNCRETKEWICPPQQSSRDFTTPEKGLLRNISNDLREILSSEDEMLNVPDNHCQHLFIYNCINKSCVFSEEKSRFNQTSEKSNIQLRKPLMVDVESKLQLGEFKSQPDIMSKPAAGSNAESMIDIRLIETSLALQNSLLGEENECKCLHSMFRSDTINDQARKPSTESVKHKVHTVHKDPGSNLGAYSAMENIQVGYSIPHVGRSEKLKINKHSIVTDKNRVSIKLGENLFLRLIAIDEKGNATCYNEFNHSSSVKIPESGEFPAVKILVKSNGETIREFSPVISVQKNANGEAVSDIEDHNQIFSVPSIKTACVRENNNILPLENGLKYLAINTSHSSADDYSHEATFRVTSNRCSKCPLFTDLYNKANQMNRRESTNAVYVLNNSTTSPLIEKNNSLRQLTNSKYHEEQLITTKGKTQERNTSPNNNINIVNIVTNEKKTTSSLKDPISLKKITSTSNQKLSIRSKTSERNNIASLGSFSLFFIINNMKTGESRCGKSDSIDLLKTAMIFLHVDNSRSKQMHTLKEITSCPVISSCPSTNISKSSCSCPSIRAVPNPSNCSCPSVKLTTMNKSPWCQSSQIRFSTSQCRSQSSLKSKQISVQAMPSYKSASIQPSKTCAPSTKKSVQTSVSKQTSYSQPSVCTTQTCSQGTRNKTRQFLSRICPPSCKITLLKLQPGLPTKTPKNVVQQPSKNLVATHTSTREMKVGTSACKNLTCALLNQAQNTSRTRVHKCVATQFKCYSNSIDTPRLSDSTKSITKKVCSFNRECKVNGYSSTSKDHIQGSAIPVSSKLKTANNFNELSHMDVSGAKKFLYSENMKGDLSLFTEDYSDLRRAFEKFMKMESGKNPKCKYVGKG